MTALVYSTMYTIYESYTLYSFMAPFYLNFNFTHLKPHNSTEKSASLSLGGIDAYLTKRYNRVSFDIFGKEELQESKCLIHVHDPEREIGIEMWVNFFKTPKRTKTRVEPWIPNDKLTSDDTYALYFMWEDSKCGVDHFLLHFMIEPVAGKKTHAKKNTDTHRKNTQTPKEHAKNTYSLLQAAKEGNIQDVRRLVKEGATLDQQDDLGQTALALAVSYKKLEVINYLVDAGADITTVDFQGMTPLHSAALSGYTEGIKRLLKKKKYMDIRDRRG